MLQVGESTFRIRLQEGRNRQIRKMCEALGFQVLHLHRDEVAGISLKGIREGQWQALGVQEMTVINAILQGKDPEAI
jgi:23S rRNA pseudouridine2604 synthase